MFFGKKSDYIKFDTVISLLEEHRQKHHFANQSSFEKQRAIEDAITTIKLHHIRANPKKYIVWKKDFTAEAKSLLKFDELEGGAE